MKKTLSLKWAHWCSIAPFWRFSNVRLFQLYGTDYIMRFRQMRIIHHVKTRFIVVSKPSNRRFRQLRNRQLRFSIGDSCAFLPQTVALFYQTVALFYSQTVALFYHRQLRFSITDSCAFLSQTVALFFTDSCAFLFTDSCAFLSQTVALFFTDSCAFPSQTVAIFYHRQLRFSITDSFAFISQTVALFYWTVDLFTAKKTF